MIIVIIRFKKERKETNMSGRSRRERKGEMEGEDERKNKRKSKKRKKRDEVEEEISNSQELHNDLAFNINLYLQLNSGSMQSVYLHQTLQK